MMKKYHKKTLFLIYNWKIHMEILYNFIIKYMLL